jgi:hypothetical protein
MSRESEMRTEQTETSVPARLAEDTRMVVAPGEASLSMMTSGGATRRARVSYSGTAAEEEVDGK